MNNFGFCVECGKVKENKQISHCNECHSRHREVFHEIKLYLMKYPSATAMDIANNTNVKVEQVMHFIRDGKIHVKF
ncbi:hypothetical protein [Alkalihalobacterium chitinilyticum]|uniref:MerR family transcriptional regulator n=1 Tax=Alkalihalobacterium chitinilyticum TaxID=2980103 RepID=A0ABT5VF56_9BACI|nr:hypothetical protein [Alkalihalobacterium chitinilyticum]MDE5414054.1 hypothetical protein [Alkalihalobacterium chitinilyticum]